MKVIATVALFALLAVSASVHAEVECPFPTGDITLIPNPEECKTYYDCTTGLPTKMPCPPGLHFNDFEKVCDYPGTACCDLRYDPKHKCPNNPAV